ncbi:arginine decarboxylase [Candidatus Viridilinea mediisalina]|uniref:arginine decarboxylase n=1 Tax=Candidatus Viridilinea mediisalina TaxID=2024553 RepID=UPI0013FE1271|nr:arginine decarboxylase [Candidatus Viridilinea mediisalina]
MVQLKQQTYTNYMQDQFGFAGEGQLTDFMVRREGELFLGGHLNLNELARNYGAPLEVVYTPQITAQVERMYAWAEVARQANNYAGRFLYAYATKANFAAEAVQTALAAGVHYETSAAADLTIAHSLFQQGLLTEDRLICCNGSKEPNYLAAIRALRLDGAANVTPVLDDLDELDALLDLPAPLQFGVRERAAGNRDGLHPGNDRFGLSDAELRLAAERIAASPHQLVLYHAMIGSQVEDEAHFLATLRASVEGYCRLRRQVPSLRYFNFGGGVPTSGYRLGFSFDYAGFLSRLMATLIETCAAYDVPVPDLIGEFGRYTVANHSVLLLEVGAVKHGQAGQPDWYLMNSSMMVSLPDALLVEGQEFVMLPLSDWDRPVVPVRLAGRRTCDSDDVYPRPHRPPLMLPNSGAGLLVAVCGVGAYQQMISGRGGAHHCLSPEPARIIVSAQGEQLVTRYVPQQDQASIMRLLGYQPRPVPNPRPLRLTPVVVGASGVARRRIQPRPLRLVREAASGD